MPRNTRMALVQGGQNIQIEGNYNYHVHPQSTSNDDAAARKRDGEFPVFLLRVHEAEENN